MNDEFDGQPRILRVQSAHINNDHHRKHSSKSPTPHRRYLNRPKSSSAPPSSSLVNYLSFFSNIEFIYFSNKATISFTKKTTIRFFMSNNNDLLWSSYQTCL